MAALRRILLTSILATGTALPALAQDDTPYDLGEIVISALRTAAERVKTGVSVSVVTDEDLQRETPDLVAAELARLPGLSLARSGPAGNTATLRIRGLDGRYQAVFVDGIRVTDPSATSVSFDFGSLLSADIGRVEVLRGSQSALWGGSAVAGVISIATAAPVEDGLHQTVTAEGGSHGTGRLTWGLTQRTDRLDLTVSATRFHTDGFSAIPGGTEDDSADIARLSFTARYQATDALVLGSALFWQRTEQDYDKYTDPDGDYVADTIVEAGFGQTRTERGARVFAELEAGNTLHSFDVALYGIRRGYAGTGEAASYKGRRLALGWQGVTTLSDRLSLVYGADWSRETGEYTNLPAGEASNRIAGVFAQAIWAPSETLDLVAALRSDDISGFGTFPTGRLSAAWHPLEGTTLHASVARGYRAPSIDERFGYYPDPTWGDFAGNPDLEPEKSWSYELGVEQEFASGAMISATAFRIEIDNLVTYKYGFPTSTLENLPGQSVSEGIELAGRLPVSDRVSLGLAYTYTDARGSNGKRLVRVPRHNLVLSLDAEISDRLSASLSATHIAGRKDNDPTTFAMVDAPDYTVIDSQVDYSFDDRTGAYLRIENLTDETYQSTLGYASSGRALYVGIKTRF
ncbi:MAG: TonB-dependent receptor [Rhodobacteraceae bacterium]|jgi:vitamin B12 transporter|nr:TonB-dependent receptor [Paracoccaceae bacterium]